MEQTLHIAAPPRLLIINADDLGICAERDAGILQLFSCGAITSASLLVDGETAAAAAASAVAAGLPLGLHLNLTEGRLDAPCSLTDTDGRLLGKFGLRQKLVDRAVAAEDLSREIRRQFNAFLALVGELPSHVDGHHHIHVEADIAAVLAPIMAHEHGVYCVRLPRQTGLDALAGDVEFDADFQRAVVAAAASAHAIFSAHDIYSTTAFLGQSLMGTRLTAAAVGDALKQLAQAHRPTPATPLSVELMVHPGFLADAGTGEAFSRSPARAHEMAVLRSADWQTATAGWQTGSYRDLRRPCGNDAEDRKPGVLIYGKLTPATGNAETARRYAAAWGPLARVRFRPVPDDVSRPDTLAREVRRLQEFAVREQLDLAFGIHLYRAGTPLAAAFASTSDSAPPLPYGLLASGTDANADVHDPVRAEAMAAAMAHADFLLCLNDDQKPPLKPLGLPENTLVLANGIDVGTESHYSLRRQLGLGNDTRLVLFPASLRRLKGVLPTVEALAELLATRFVRHVLVVLGPVLEADYASELRTRIAALMAQHAGLQGRILLHDGLPHEDYLAVLREADLVLNASEHEGLSHALAESMAAGIPVLARDIAGNRLLIRDGENGRLFAGFAALPERYAECFDKAEATAHLATMARTDIARRFPAEDEQSRLQEVLKAALERRQVRVGNLRLDLADGTHPVSADNLALFDAIALSPQLPRTTPLACDIGCGCGVFGVQLLRALARDGRQVQRMLFVDPHRPSLAGLERSLIRHGGQLGMLTEARLDDGSLLEPLLRHGERATLICANLPQTPSPQDFRLDRSGGQDGADLICRFLDDLPRALAPGGEAFLLHISLANPGRVAAAIASIGFVATELALQTRHARLADYEAMHEGLSAHLLATRKEGRAIFVPDEDGTGFTFEARLLRLQRPDT